MQIFYGDIKKTKLEVLITLFDKPKWICCELMQCNGWYNGPDMKPWLSVTVFAPGFNNLAMLTVSSVNLREKET